MFIRRWARSLLALTALAAATIPTHFNAVHAEAGTFMVGADAQDLSPSPAMIATNRLFLGGYGLSNGQAGLGSTSVQGPVVKPRFATGVMNDPFGPWVRAIAIGNGSRTVVFTNLDNQGMFAAYKINPETGQQRPYGIDDIRDQLAAETGLAQQNIVISSDHSHAGQDLTGVWGFVPDEYLAFVKTQAVTAIKNALANMRPATINEGAVLTPGPYEADRILSNQFDQTDEGQNTVDSELRVLQAKDKNDGSTIATVVNFAAHATVMGSSNTLISSDWPSTVARYVERRYGGVGVTLVADVGRSQPNDQACTSSELAGALAGTNGLDADSRQADQSCSVSRYATRVMDYVNAAIASPSFTALTDTAVDSNTYFIHEVATAAALYGMNYAGDPIGAPISRATTPPYFTGTVLGTWVSTFRVGDLLITTNPGEAYPNIRDQLMTQVSGPRRFWTIGLANDQLGYLIAPTPEAYPIAIRHGVAVPNVIGNDNYFFNVSHTIGDHVMCKQVQGAGALGFASSPTAKCAPFIAEPSTAGPGGSRPLA